jgi:CRP/FNR family cyclic AMP-dependent transcriptional regulator
VSAVTCIRRRAAFEWRSGEPKKVGFSRHKQMVYRIRVISRKKRRIMPPADAMRTPYGLQVIESCLSCPMVKDRLFCNLPPGAVEGLDAISSSSTYPKGALLFVEGQEPRGVFVICNGRVKLSAGSAGGKSLILRIAEAGELVGIPGTISGQPYEVTAEALEPIQANFIPREEFLRFLRTHGDAALRVAEILCRVYQATYQEVKYLGLSGSAEGKVARFLLDLTHSCAQDDEPIRATLTLTHEEIGQMIGASRETVTRLFASFKKKRLIEIHGSTLVVKSRANLEKLVTA